MTPDNGVYYHAAYAAAAVIFAIYTATIAWRLRGIRRRRGG